LLCAGALFAPASVQAFPLLSEHAGFFAAKDTLCGKLVFFENTKTGEQLIGLAPCGQMKPIIFGYRPNILHDYYRLQDVVIRTGPPVPTLYFGTITSYITHFSASFAIEDCDDCKISAPTWTPRPEQASLNCADWIIETSATQLGAQAPELTQTDLIRFQIREYNNSPEVNQQCGADETCRAHAISIKLGSLLGAIFRSNQLSAQLVSSEQVIGFLKYLLTAPDYAKICQPSPQAAWDMLIGLDQQGYPIQGIQTITPATQLCQDAAGRQTGILPDGLPAQEIPSSALIVAGRVKYTLLVAGSASQITLRGNGTGALNLQLIDFAAGNVLLARFENIALTDKTQAELLLSAGQPVLKIDILGDGNLQAFQPVNAETYPLLQAGLPTLAPAVPLAQPALATDAPATAALPVSPTLSPQPSVVPSFAALSTTPLPVATAAPPQRFPNPCASTGGLAAIVFSVWLWNKRR